MCQNMSHNAINNIILFLNKCIWNI
jgi:hypothetical protein